MTPDDDRIEQLTEWMKYDSIDNPTTLLYVSHNDSNGPERSGIKSLFYDKDWAEVNEQRVPYHKFLSNLSNSGINLRDIQTDQSSLEEIFVNLVKEKAE